MPRPDDKAWSEGYNKRSRAAEALSNDGNNSDADTNANNSLLGYLLNTNIKADNNNSKTEAGVAHNRALK
jgi:hypothetical protein